MTIHLSIGGLPSFTLECLRTMSKLLEVIVTSAAEAQEAEAGGADRLELVRALDQGGLTPATRIVAQVVTAVSIPVRVMLRENPSMSIRNEAELAHLRACAGELADFQIDGFVLGFSKRGLLDRDSIYAVLEKIPRHSVTFHRAFEHISDPLHAIAELKAMRQFDRILTNGGEGPWRERIRTLIEWQTAAAPEIQILAGAGLTSYAIEELRNAPQIAEVHVGRAARVPQAVDGLISRERIAELKSALG